jgi:NTE family protein
MSKRGLVLSGGGGRGAYQAGVYKYLTEKNFYPEVISGTSVGAINAVALGCGLRPEQLISLWKTINIGTVMRYRFFRAMMDFFLNRLSPIADPTPLERFLNDNLNFDVLRSNHTQVYITATNILNGELEIFSNQEISVKHILASAAIPMVFPWQKIGTQLYWDGGLMANTPILPLLEKDIRDIVVVLLSPIGHLDSDIPKNRSEVFERVFELIQIGSFQNFKYSIESGRNLSNVTISEMVKSQFKGLIEDWLGGGEFRLRIVSPKVSLGMKSILNFSPSQADHLIKTGYEDAREQLGSLED